MNRIAELSAQIAERLYLKRNWSDEDRAQHKADVLEREALISAAYPRYGEILRLAREAGLLDA